MYLVEVLITSCDQPFFNTIDSCILSTRSESRTKFEIIQTHTQQLITVRYI